jgi:hypothetical protein
MKNEGDTLLLVVLIILLVAGSAVFWERHGRFLQKCTESGRSSEECWGILR